MLPWCCLNILLPVTTQWAMAREHCAPGSAANTAHTPTLQNSSFPIWSLAEPLVTRGWSPCCWSCSFTSEYVLIWCQFIKLHKWSLFTLGAHYLCIKVLSYCLLAEWILCACVYGFSYQMKKKIQRSKSKNPKSAHKPWRAWIEWQTRGQGKVVWFAESREPWVVSWVLQSQREVMSHMHLDLALPTQGVTLSCSFWEQSPLWAALAPHLLLWGPNSGDTGHFQCNINHQMKEGI